MLGIVQLSTAITRTTEHNTARIAIALPNAADCELRIRQKQVIRFKVELP